VLPPPARILRAEQAVEIRCELLADPIQVFRNDAIGDPAAEVHQPGDHRITEEVWRWGWYGCMKATR